jgi:UDP-glucose 4-epimerase
MEETMASLVTGGAGFIGSNLVDQLVTMGDEVVVIDDFSEGKLENLARWNGNTRLRVVNGSVLDFDLVRKQCENKKWVFHCAAMSRIEPSIGDPLLAWHQNVIGTGNVLEAARRCGVERVVYSGSSSVYGDQAVAMHEDMPTDCLNPYALSKKTGEEMAHMYRRLYGLSTISLRYFNVYGPRHQESGAYATAIGIFRRQKRHGQKLTIVGDGEQRRDFTFVADVVRANIMAAENREAVGVFNVGGGTNYSINEVAALIGGEREHILPRLGEARATLADLRKVQDVLGWRPTFSLKKGLEVLERYEQHEQSTSASKKRGTAARGARPAISGSDGLRSARDASTAD